MIVCAQTVQPVRVNSGNNTCRERHEGVSLEEFALFVQKMRGVKGARTLPFTLIIQDGSEKRQDSGSLHIKKKGFVKNSTFLTFTEINICSGSANNSFEMKDCGS